MADSAYRVVKACRLCDSEQLTVALDLGETPLANELDGTELFPLVVMRCDACEHHQLSIAVSPARLWGPSYPYQSGTSPVFRKHLEALADEVAALKPGGRVLEIASNDGTLVRMLAARGCVTRGIDPSGPFDEGDNFKLFPQSWPGDGALFPATAIGKESAGADVIIALNVFAHVDDLHGFTAAVKEALAPDGVFIVEVGYANVVTDSGLFDVIYHEHFSYHDIKSLYPFFKRHGLAIVCVEGVDSQGGSLRLHIQHDHSQPVQIRARGPGEAEAGNLHLAGMALMGREKASKMAAMTKADFSALVPRITRTKVSLADALENAGTVAGYGCPAKLTTLMYATGLDRERITRIYDDNPLKVGRTTPGTLIPIVPSANLIADAPGTLILFAWNFASEIIPRLRAQGYRGRIVTPLPEVQIDEC